MRRVFSRFFALLNERMESLIVVKGDHALGRTVREVDMVCCDPLPTEGQRRVERMLSARLLIRM